jgi:hypothetical protein
MNADAKMGIPAELADVAEHPFLRGRRKKDLESLATCAMHAAQTQLIESKPKRAL